LVHAANALGWLRPGHGMPHVPQWSAVVATPAQKSNRHPGGLAAAQLPRQLGAAALQVL